MPRGSKRRTNGAAATSLYGSGGHGTPRRSKGVPLPTAGMQGGAAHVKTPTDFIGHAVTVHVTDGNRITDVLEDVTLVGMDSSGLVVHREYRKKVRAFLIPWMHAAQTICDGAKGMESEGDEEQAEAETESKEDTVPTAPLHLPVQPAIDVDNAEDEDDDDQSFYSADDED